jgi:hypothetical protein
VSAYNVGQLFGVLLLVAIAVGIFRDYQKKHNGDDDKR